jgi:CBS domain containing-hemolysin-like protein
MRSVVALLLFIQFLLIALAVVYRAAVNTLLCALQALPSLHRRLLLEETLGESLSPEALERPQALNMALMLWNQTLLVLLLILLWPFRYSLPGAGWMLAALMFIYVWVMDTALPAIVISANPAAWVERLFPFCSPMYKLLLPVLAPLSAYREKSQQANEKTREEDETQTEEAIEAFLEEGEAEGILEEEDSELIRNVVNLGDTIVREVMTPRNRIQGIPSDASLDEVWEAFRVNRYSRIPVYQNAIENIQGVLMLKDLIQIKWQEDTKWASLVKPPIFVPESKPTLELLRELQRAKTQMAIVVDEYGAVAGLATIEDLLEEVVGEIQDEHESSATLHESSPGVYSVPGETHVDDLASAMDIELEHEGFDTVAGLVMWKLGRVPNPLETVRVQNLVLRVLKMEGPRIILVEARADGV